MTDIKLYTKLSGLSEDQQAEVVKFIGSIKPDSQAKFTDSVAGKAKGLLPHRLMWQT